MRYSNSFVSFGCIMLRTSIYKRETIYTRIRKQNSVTGWVAGQSMLKLLSSCKTQTVRIVASSVEVHCSRCRRQKRCALRLYESWRLSASSLHDWSRKILETSPSRPPRPRPAMPRPRPRPPKNGLEWSRDQDRGLEDYITAADRCERYNSFMDSLSTIMYM